MLLPSLPVGLLLFGPLTPPDDRTVDFDQQTDFSQFKTFALGPTQLRSPKPELNSDITRRKIQDALRAEFTKRGVREAPIESSDVVVVTNNTFSEATLVVDVRSNAAKIASNLSRDVEKLFDKYPVKKK
jgi:Domain of unknown function (DUF4136)